MSYSCHVVAAGVFLMSPAKQILMVQTFNRLGAGLILPGGLVEADESPAAAAAREVAEEIGLKVTIRCLLAVEYRAARDGRPSSLQFVFGAEGLVPENVALTMQPEEIAEAHWVHRNHVVERHGLAGQSRMQAALKALDSGVPVYLES